ncbi:hypothetical protein L596_000100 [Steinernema carpocapsae]|uniref:Wntless-like transmembrane domain-containing protein n=1 Tax=Steinernema carpocapsae TaxID=34508 RepID=A0A4U8UHW0_STECR|nr:hypothetical protein L596_000100 [Steinernema carpocapsae]
MITAFVVFPIEWMSLWFRLPFMLLIADIRQGLFYFVLFAFWLIFADEHLNENKSYRTLMDYWRNLLFITIASVALLVYDICERGMQLSNPFFSIWSSDIGSNFALATIYIASICTSTRSAMFGPRSNKNALNASVNRRL